MVCKLHLKSLLWKKKKKNLGLFLRKSDRLVFFFFFWGRIVPRDYPGQTLHVLGLCKFFSQSALHPGGLLMKNGIFPCDKVILTKDMSFRSPQQPQVSQEPSGTSLPSFKEVTGLTCVRMTVYTEYTSGYFLGSCPDFPNAYCKSSAVLYHQPYRYNHGYP